jgi:hypothetical protein
VPDDAFVEHAVDAGGVLPGAGPDLGPRVPGRQVREGRPRAVGGEDGGQDLLPHAEAQAVAARREHAGFPEHLEDEAVFPDLPVVEGQASQPARPVGQPGRFDVRLTAQAASQPGVDRGFRRGAGGVPSPPVEERAAEGGAEHLHVHQGEVLVPHHALKGAQPGAPVRVHRPREAVGHQGVERFPQPPVRVAAQRRDLPFQGFDPPLEGGGPLVRARRQQPVQQRPQQDRRPPHASAAEE